MYRLTSSFKCELRASDIAQSWKSMYFACTRLWVQSLALQNLALQNKQNNPSTSEIHREEYHVSHLHFWCNIFEILTKKIQL